MNLTQLPACLSSLSAMHEEHVPVAALLGLVSDETPQAIADRLGILAEDYPAGVPVDLVDIERRRAVELAFMVDNDLIG